jgi:hypothetical protein
MDVSSAGSSDLPEPKREGNAHALFEGPRIVGTVAELADVLDRMASSLETSSTFNWDFYTGDFAGTAIIDQYLSQQVNRPRQPYRLMMDITYGEGDFDRHDDREDVEEGVESGQVATSSVEGADQAAVVAALRDLSSAMRAGQVVVGDRQAEFGDSATLGFGHAAAYDGSSKKIEMQLSWPTAPPPEIDPQAQVEQMRVPPVYAVETSMPVTEFAEMLRRIATEILEDGTFMLEGEEIAVSDTVGGEISIGTRGMSIEVGWRR